MAEKTKKDAKPKDKKKGGDKKPKDPGAAGAIARKLTLGMIILFALGSLALAGWGAADLGSSMAQSWGTGSVRSDGLPSVIRGDAFVVNLADRRSQHYARLDYALVLSPGTAEEDVRGRIPMIQEMVTPYFLSRSASQLATPEGFEQARREMNRVVRAVYAESEVERVVVSELVVQ